MTNKFDRHNDMHSSLYRGKLDLIKEKIEQKALIKEAAEESLKSTTEEEETLKEKIVKKALLKKKLSDDDSTDIKTKLKEAEYEAEAAKADAEKADELDGKLTMKDKIAKKKEALKLNKEVKKAQEALKDEKHAVEEALEKGDLTKELKKQAIEDAADAETVIPSGT
jgi:hypothetical protein